MALATWWITLVSTSADASGKSGKEGEPGLGGDYDGAATKPLQGHCEAMRVETEANLSTSFGQCEKSRDAAILTCSSLRFLHA